MKISVEEIDGSYYVDVFLSRKELEAVAKEEMVMGEMTPESKKFYVGICLDYFNDFDDEEEYAP